MRRWLPLLIGLSACGTETVTFPPDLWAWEGEGNGGQTWAIRDGSVQFGCDAADESWSLVFETEWETRGSGDVTLFGVDPEYTEVHELHELAGGQDERFGVGPLTDASAYADGESTAYDCEADEHLVGVFIEFRDESAFLIDCAWTGPAYENLTSKLERRPYQRLGGCLRFEI